MDLLEHIFLVMNCFLRKVGEVCQGGRGETSTLLRCLSSRCEVALAFCMEYIPKHSRMYELCLADLAPMAVDRACSLCLGSERVSSLSCAVEAAQSTVR